MDPVDVSAIAAPPDEQAQLLSSADGVHRETTRVPDALKAKRARWGFYLYSWAVEVYAVVSLTLFLPITLEQYAREAGKLTVDHTKPCADTTDVCVVSLLGIWVNSASFSLYTYSISVAMQALTVIAISGKANDGNARKKLLSLFTLIGSMSCLLFLIIPSHTVFWPISSLLVITGNVAFGASIVCLNAYLPILAQDILQDQAATEIDEIPDMTDVQDCMASVRAKTSHALSRATSAISSKGIAAGYGAGIFLLLLTLVPVTLMKGSLFSLRSAIAASGIWWFAFSIPALAYLPSSSDAAAGGRERASASQPWSELYHILKQYRKIPETFKYLLAWFVMSDAFATITSVAILFAKTTLGMSAQELVWVGVVTPLCGIVGALAWPRLQNQVLGTTNLGTLRIIVALAALIPLWGLVALNTKVELLLLACYFGALYGALQSYSRACYSHLIPAKEEARFFALYSITDKSSSFIGPAAVAIIADKTGSIRAGFVFLLVALLLPLPILHSVNMEQGHDDARHFQEYIP